MGYEKGREALKTENELLAKLYDVTADHAKSLPKGAGLAAFIVNDWAGSFQKLRKLNEQLISEDDEAFSETLSSERDLLQRLLEVTSKNGGFGESWASLFKEDTKIVDSLLAQ